MPKKKAPVEMFKSKSAMLNHEKGEPSKMSKKEKMMGEKEKIAKKKGKK